MVGIVVVSHSDALAEGVVTLAREMGGDELALVAAGGTDEPGVLGTDATRVMAAIEQAMSPDGVLVLMDLGSALMSTELAVDLLGETPGRVVLSEAPLVEGTVAAAASASGGASLDEVAAEARGALAMKTSQLGGADDAAPAPDAVPALDAAPAPDAPRHRPTPRRCSRSATRSGCTRARRRGSSRPCGDSTPTFGSRRSGGVAPVTRNSLTRRRRAWALGLATTLAISASGPQADDVLLALAQLADEGFGDGIAAGAPSPSNATATRPTSALPPANASSSLAGQPARHENGAAIDVAPPAAGDVLTGVPASAGLAFGPAHHLHGATAPPPDRAAEDPPRERERLNQGIAAARTAIERDREHRRGPRRQGRGGDLRCPPRTAR